MTTESFPFQKFLQLASMGRALSAADMSNAMDLILEGTIDDIQVAGFLMALKARGETVDEITAAARAMRTRAEPVALAKNIANAIIDTAGTGGDGAGTYNISTAAAIIAAGCGVKVAKHGNRAATSLSGSSDILSTLGVNLQATPKIIAECIENANIGFMFAAYHHKATANVAAIRKSLGVRTIFNLLGPLTNPAGAKKQIIGVYDMALCRPIATALKALGATNAWVVHGHDGLDELTTTTSSHVCALKNDEIQEFVISPQDAGLNTASTHQLQGGSPEENAKALMALLQGEKGPYRDIALLNTAAALIVAGHTKTLEEGVSIGSRNIDNGNAMCALSNLIKTSNRPETNK